MAKVKDLGWMCNRPGAYRAWDSEKKGFCIFHEGGIEPAYMQWDSEKNDYVLVIPAPPSEDASKN